MLDTPIELDMAVVSEAIATAEVLTIFFPWLGQALILDTRHDVGAPPAVFTDRIVGSVEERLRLIMQARPMFPQPDQLTALPWLAGTDSFVGLGVYGEVVRRCYRLGYGDLEGDCRRALDELRRAERTVKLAYARGDFCRTLYQRQRR